LLIIHSGEHEKRRSNNVELEKKNLIKVIAQVLF